jgi:hypothetical protein
MAQYRIATPQGSAVVEAPEGATKAEVIELYNRTMAYDGTKTARQESAATRGYLDAQAEQARQTALSREAGVLDYLGEVPKGLIGGAANLVEQGAVGLAALLPEGAEDVVRGGIKAVGGAVQDYVSPDIGIGDSVPRKLSEGVGSFVGLAGVSMLNPLAGAGLAVSAGAGEASERARAAGATEDERSLAALAGIVPGALELLPIGFLKALGRDGVRSILNTTARVLSSGGVEAAQEATAAVIQNLIAQGIYKPDQKLIEGVGEQAAYGGAVGAIVQGLIELATPRTRGGASAATPAAEQETLALPAPEGIAGLITDRRPQEARETIAASLDETGEVPLAAMQDIQSRTNLPLGTLESIAQEEMDKRGSTLAQRAQTDMEAELDAATAPETTAPVSRLSAAVEDSKQGVGAVEGRVTRDAQAAQVAAREREALRAADRGDIAAFEQPDLFARELETARRDPRGRSLQNITSPEQAVETQAPSDQFDPDAAQGDLVDLINQDKAREDNANVRKATEQARKKEEDIAVDTELGLRDMQERVSEPARRAQDRERPEQLSMRGQLFQPKSPMITADMLPPPLKGRPDAASGTERATPIADGRGASVEGVIQGGAATSPDGASAGKDTQKTPTPDAGPVGQPVSSTADAPAGTVAQPSALINRVKAKLEEAATTGLKGTAATAPIQARNIIENMKADGQKIGREKAVLIVKDLQKQGFLETPNFRGEAKLSPTRNDAPGEADVTPTTKQVTLEPTYPAFKKEAVDQAAKQNDKSREILVDMPIDDFLAAAKQEKSPEKLAAVKDLLSKGIPFETVPSLQFANNGDGTAKVVGHDGRHRAMALKERGETTIPVRLTSNAGNGGKGDAIRWGQQNDPKSPDYVATLPQTLIAEDSDAKVAMPAKAKDIRKTPTTKQDTPKATPTPGAAEATSLSVKQTTQKAKPTPGTAKSKPEGKPVATKTNADLVVEAVAEYRKIKVPTGAQAVAFVSRLTDLGIANPPAFLANLQKMKEQLKLPADLTLEFPVDTSVSAAVESGDLKGALEALATTAPDAKVQRIAKKLASNVGNTQLVTKKNLKADDGSAVAGYFDPETNTIFLDAETGISTHPILHEVLHAVTSATVANKSHPLTKKLTRIFEGVQEQLAGEYGLTSLDEFVAEAMSNPEFQTQLKTTTVNGRNPWQQLVRAVSNYVRRMLGLETKPEGSTLDAVDEIVQAMIAPTFDGRIATKIYMQIKTPAGAGKLINGMAANVVNVVKEKGWYEAARDWVGGATPPKAKSVFLDFMELRILSELASKKIPEALKLNDLVNNMSDNLKVENKRLLPIIADLTNLMAKNKKDFATLRFLLPNSSAERIDPRVKDFDKAYGRDKGDVDAVKLAKVIHKDLHAEWNSMGAEGKRLYSTVTNMFESRFDDAMDSTKENIRVMFGEDAAKAEATIKNLAEKLGIDRGRIRPYMPLGRDGNYRLEFNTLDPRTKRPEQFVEYYATAKLRNKAKDNIKAYEDKLRAELPKGDVGLEFLGQTPLEGMRDSTFNFDKAPQGSFVANVLNTLKADGVDSASINSIIELAIDSMPERSFMQAFRTRKDTRGFLGDVTPTGMAQEAFDLIDTVQSKGRDYNRQVVQMQFGAKIQALKNEINEKYKYKDIDESTSLFKKKLLKIADFAQAPNVSRLSQNITGAAYAWTMGLNLSSAATAVFDVPMSVYPRLAGKFGDKDAVYALAAAVRMLSNAPKESITETYGAEIDPATGKPIMVKRKINEGFAGYSNTNYDFDEIRAMSKAEMDKAGMSQKERQDILDTEVLVEVGSRNAQYNSSLNHEHLDVTRGKDQANFLGLKINMETVNAFSSFLFHHSERYSREVTMQAAYRLELNRLRDKPNNTEKKLSDLEKKYIAAEYAVSETQLSLGATASAGRPIISQNAIGNVAMLFKRFAISKYYMMARMTDEAFKNAKTADEKAMRSMARGQLGRFMVTSAAFAGVAGMPLMGAIGQIYDLFADEEDDTFDAVLLKTFGEPFSSGLINAALGVDVASRINMNSLLYRPPIIEKDQPAAYTLLEQLGGPAVGIYLSFDRGYDLFNEGEFVRGTEAILPAAFRNVLKSGKQFFTGEVATRRGDAVVEDIGLGQILGQLAGFANADVIRQYAINKNERRKDTYLTTTRTRLLRAANIAAAERDTDGYKDAMKRIREYNKNLPRASRSKLIILPDTIKKSRTAFNTRTSNMIGGIEYTPEMRRSLKEYDQGIQLFD